MTAPTRQPRESQPYPVAAHAEDETTEGGWVPVFVAGIVAAVAIAIAGIIAGLIVVNIREGDVAEAPAPTPAAAAPSATEPATPALAAPAAPVIAAEPEPAPTPQLLDRTDLQLGVQLILIDTYDLDNARDVRCPDGQQVVVGATFDCTVRLGSALRTATVTITGTDGTYEVARPE